MKKFILTVLSFIALGAYNHAMAQSDGAEKNPNLDDEGSYKGGRKMGKMHGQGIYEWKNGDRFEGNFENGQINGYGRYSWTDGNVYQGDFKDGKQSGMGTAFYADKCNVYEGEWKNGKRNGHGKLTWANGDTYEGEWVDDVRTCLLYTSPSPRDS